jgi:hypothetical protein
MATTNETFAMFNDLGSKGYEAAQALGEINLRAVETLVARQMDVVNLLMEGGLRQVKMASEAKGYSDLVKGQIELARELAERLMEESRTNVKLASDTRDEYRGWMEKGVQLVSENLNQARTAA